MGPQRLYTRYSFSASATIIVDNSGSRIPAQVANISGSGCRLLTDVRLSVGSQIAVQIHTATEFFEAPATVVHCANDGVGLMFHNESPKYLLVLNKWIEQAKERAEAYRQKEKKPYVPPRITEYKPEDVRAWATSTTESRKDDLRTPHSSRGKTPKRVLVADDDTSIRAVVCKGIEHRLGFVCDEAENGWDAIAKVKQRKTDLVVLDLAMPVMNGFEAAMVLQRDMPKMPVIILSMYVHAQFAATLASTFGFKAIISKAEGVSSLIDCVQKILG